MQFQVCYYTPVSYVLFMIALTFPLKPDAETIAIYNLWFKLLYKILPINAPFETYLQKIGYHAEHTPCLTRDMFVNLCFQMHQMVTGEQLDRLTTLQFFDCLRANDCKSKSAGAVEGTCRRTSQKMPSVCIISITSQPTKGNNTFAIDTELSLKSSEEKEDILINNENAFCSCVFSAKWFLLHMIASRFPEHEKDVTTQQRYEYHTWITLFGKVLACVACRVNFKSNLQLSHYDLSKDLKTRATFCDFANRLHNNVNAMLHKNQTNIGSAEKTCAFYDTLASKTTSKHHVSILIAPEKNYTSRFYFTA